MEPVSAPAGAEHERAAAAQDAVGAAAHARGAGQGGYLLRQRRPPAPRGWQAPCGPAGHGGDAGGQRDVRARRGGRVPGLPGPVLRVSQRVLPTPVRMWWLHFEGSVYENTTQSCCVSCSTNIVMPGFACPLPCFLACRQHVLLNRGLPGATSQVTAPCVHSMVPPSADLVVVEFSTNDSPSEWDSRGKAGYEGLLRSLLALPGGPAVVLLHHYAFLKAAGDGRSAGLFYREPEGQLTLLSHFYDIPSLSLRAAAWRLMQAGIEGFKVDRTILEGNRDAATGDPIPAAEPGMSGDYLYLDTIHPGPNGHRALSELLAGLLTRAVGEAAAGTAPPPRQDPRLQGLPPPMSPAFWESVPSFCAQLEDFRGMVVAQRGFSYRPERPQLARFEEQKWGWASERPGSWVEIEVDTRPCAGQPPGAANCTLAAAQAAVLLGHLRSYAGMGTAAIQCRSGCSCRPSTLDGTSASRASVFKIHSFKVTQHRRCRFRVTVSKEPGATPQQGHKVMLAAIMVAHTPQEQPGS
ncbi:hypothetical protein ABPG75_009108 [Micractinium tetrahymenae]